MRHSEKKQEANKVKFAMASFFEEVAGTSTLTNLHKDFQDIFEVLMQKNKINREDLLKIYENHNNYIVGFDNYKTSLKIENDISQVVSIVNSAYKASKMNLVMSAKINENNNFDFATLLIFIKTPLFFIKKNIFLKMKLHIYVTTCI